MLIELSLSLVLKFSKNAPMFGGRHFFLLTLYDNDGQFFYPHVFTQWSKIVWEQPFTWECFLPIMELKVSLAMIVMSNWYIIDHHQPPQYNNDIQPNTNMHRIPQNVLLLIEVKVTPVSGNEYGNDANHYSVTTTRCMRYNISNIIDYNRPLHIAPLHNNIT